MTVYKFLEKLDIDTSFKQNIPKICLFYNNEIANEKICELAIDITKDDAMKNYGDYILLNWTLINGDNNMYLCLHVQDMGC